MKKILLGLMLLGVIIHAKIPETKQLIVVRTGSWNDHSGSLQRYEKVHGEWQRVGESIRVKLGRNGLGWGRGLHTTPKKAKYIKKEGDGRSPAGIFMLKQAFGYAPFKVRYPYEVYRETDHCVDDVHSKFYNKIVDSTKVAVDYHSQEHMKFPKDFYKYGIVVNHNHIDEKGAVPGAGSCIFIHIKTVPTAGCTVMQEAEIKDLIHWLNPADKPLLLQGPEEVVERLWKVFL
jgi:D-alanyl-D-alanine dipeptidase